MDDILRSILILVLQGGAVDSECMEFDSFGDLGNQKTEKRLT